MISEAQKAVIEAAKAWADNLPCDVDGCPYEWAAKGLSRKLYWKVRFLKAAEKDAVRALPPEDHTVNEFWEDQLRRERKAVEEKRKAFVDGAKWWRSGHGFGGGVPEREPLLTGEAEADRRYPIPEAYAEESTGGEVYKPKQDDDVLPIIPGTGCTCHYDDDNYNVGWKTCPIHGKPEADILEGAMFVQRRDLAPLRKRIEVLEGRMDIRGQGIDGVHTHIGGMDKRIAELERIQKAQHARLNDMDRHIEELERRTTYLPTYKSDMETLSRSVLNLQSIVGDEIRERAKDGKHE